MSDMRPPATPRLLAQFVTRAALRFAGFGQRPGFHRAPRRRLMAMLVLFVALPAPLLAEARLPLLPEATRAGFAAIGRLNRAGYRSRGMCSASLVAPNLILTAAHCLWRPDGRPVTLPELRFVAGWDRGSAVAVAGIVRAEIAPGALVGGAIDPRRDLALLTLDTVVDLPPLPLAPPDLPPAPYAIVAYEASRPHAPGGRFDCNARLRGLLTLQTACAVEHGASGGPVLARTASGWQIVGVVSARAGDVTLIPRTRGWDRLDRLRE